MGGSQAQVVNFALEPEIRSGLIVPNADFYPDPGLQKDVLLNFSWLQKAPERDTEMFFAPMGLQIGFTDYGNASVFGQSFQALGFLGLKTGQRIDRFVEFRLALGPSYFTQFYDEEENSRNKSIGSSVNWNFQAFLYYNLLRKENRLLRLSAGYSHHSNAHIQLPNFGLNSALVGISYGFYSRSLQQSHEEWDRSGTFESDALYTLSVRSGYGIHEFGGTIGPVGGTKRSVLTQSIAIDQLRNHRLRYSAGIAFRYYEHFDHYLDTVSEPDTELNPYNVYFFLGAEVIFGRIGAEFNGGLNLYKPFHDTYNDTFERSEGISYFIKRYFPSRLAINIYAIPPRRSPSWNMCIGPSINANFGEADFGEFSFRLLRRISQK
jgi:hypothetical protein